MTLATLKDVLPAANRQGYAVAGLVCLGWEDMRAYVAAAEAEDTPIILQAGPGCCAHTPLPVLAAMMRNLAEPASVPVVVHLDHGASLDDCRAALDAGFTSVMYDGSRLPLAENIARTAEVSALARAAGASCEGEIGFVGYAQGAASTGTIPEEARAFVEGTGVDAVAVSVGNVHLQEESGAQIDYRRLADIESLIDTPLVIHGGSGVGPEDRKRLARDSQVGKVNIGTELRMAFGAALNAALAADPKAYDRLEILAQTHEPVMAATRQVLQSLR